ncbi:MULTISPECIES: transposase [Sinorhizobium]|uniref:transposase n=1 Tax=Sinorhizobium TaxID=28105 RepID=UPI001F20ED42|nr:MULTISPECIES: transposase [Sinorhizobium]
MRLWIELRLSIRVGVVVLKLQTVAESYSEPGLCATTARRHGISRSQLYEWRRLARA